MGYLIDRSSPSRTIYRYQLHQSGKLKNSDGLIVVEKAGKAVRYTEYDFWDADYGLLKTLAPSKIWTASVEGIYQSDVAIQLKAEHPDWDYAKVRKESEEAKKGFPFEDKVKERKPFRFPSTS
jgi:HD-GYP domain-containing protein (c-di-GMP phosphodiesterase class II)